MNQAGQEFDKRNCNGAIKVGGKIEKYKVQNTSKKTERQTDRVGGYRGDCGTMPSLSNAMYNNPTVESVAGREA